VFDLDGTLTRHDTLVPYLGAALRRYPRRALGLLRAPLALAEFALGRDRGRLKSRLIRALLGGLTREQTQLATHLSAVQRVLADATTGPSQSACMTKPNFPTVEKVRTAGGRPPEVAVTERGSMAAPATRAVVRRSLAVTLSEANADLMSP